MYLIEGKRLVAPWIHNAMGRTDDDVGRDKRACAHNHAAVATHVDWPIAPHGAFSCSITLLSPLPNLSGCGSSANARTMVKDNATQRMPAAQLAHRLRFRATSSVDHSAFPKFPFFQRSVSAAFRLTIRAQMEKSRPRSAGAPRWCSRPDALGRDPPRLVGGVSPCAAV